MSKFRDLSTEALEQQRAAAKRLLLAQQASESLLDYIRLGMPDPDDPENTDVSMYETTPQARLLCQVFEKAAKGELKRVAVSIGPQMGKLIADDTPIWTPDGWRKHGDLRVGDWVWHPSGKPVLVWAVSEPGFATLEVVTDQGDVIAVHPAHEWKVFDGERHRVIETRLMAELLRRNARIMLPWSEAPGGVTGGARVLEVRPVDEPREGRCIQVAAADGLYVVGAKNTVTHNSEIISRRGPAWFSAKNPRRHFMLGTYNQDFANEFGQWVRRYIRSSYHRQVFTDHRLTPGSAASDHMVTDLGGQLAFVGVGGSGTGKPADFFVVDDPYRNDDDARSEAYRERVWTWFNSVVFSRCHSNSSIVVVHCLTGDTLVRMADGTDKALRDIRAGDKVLAWEDGRFARREVLKWAPQGEDDVFEVKTGNSTVRGNARHPFLVIKHGIYQWVKIADLKRGDEIVMSATEPHASAARISQNQAWLLGFFFGDGWVTVRDGTLVNRKGVTRPRRSKVLCAARKANDAVNEEVLGRFEAEFGFRPKLTKFGYWRTEKQVACRWFYDHGLRGGSKSKRLPEWLFAQPLDVREAFLEGFRRSDAHTDKKQQTTFAVANYGLLQDLRTLARGAGVRVSNVHVCRQTTQPPNSPAPIDSTIWSFKFGLSRRTSAFTTSRVRSVTPVGREMVYDIQVDKAESFIADGCVVHNTRWNQDDLIGRLCDPDHPERNKRYAGIADEWTYIDLPAIVKDQRLADALGLTLELPSKTITEKRDLAKVVEQFGDVPMSSLWPARKGLPFLAEARRNHPRVFDALYMGKPAPDDGDYFKAEWMHEYSADELPKALRIYAASDHALKAKEANDATCMGVVGVDERNDLWILDVRWDRMNTLDQVENMLELGRRWRPIVWWAGQDHISGSIGPFLKKRMQETGVYLHISEVSEKGDKEQKAQAFKGFAALGKVHFPRSASWWQDARKEILLFPHGAHDDFVDFLSLIGRGLNRQVAATPTKTITKPTRGTYAYIKSLYRASARQQKVRTALAGM